MEIQLCWDNHRLFDVLTILDHSSIQGHFQQLKGPKHMEPPQAGRLILKFNDIMILADISTYHYHHFKR